MIDKRRLICMAKMAAYDKKSGESDRRMDEFFRHDYIAKKNFRTRICVFVGGVFVILFYWLHKIVIDGVDIFTVDYRQAGLDMAVFLIALIAAYTVIGSAKAAVEYTAGQKRMKEYLSMLNQLERLKARSEEIHTAKRRTGEVTDLYYGADIADTRDDD